jgi:FkbM family methyltransferase
MLPSVKRAIDLCGFKNVQLESAALWSCDTELSFNNEKGRAASAISSERHGTVKGVSLDNLIPADERVTFIKLDVEGAELEALKGSENLIIRSHPKIAVCIYHKPDDYYKIQEYINSIVPDYKFFIRHYHYTAMETVLYCVL